MITELLGLAGSSVFGSVFGMISNTLEARGRRKDREVELELARRAKENGQSLDFLNSETGFATRPAYSLAFVVLTVTYCICTMACFYWPDIAIHTFNPDDEPRKYSLLWGLFSWQFKANHVYVISTGGVGYALLHPIAFQIGTVITGVNPIGRKH